VPVDPGTGIRAIDRRKKKPPPKVTPQAIRFGADTALFVPPALAKKQKPPPKPVFPIAKTARELREEKEVLDVQRTLDAIVAPVSLKHRIRVRQGETAAERKVRTNVAQPRDDRPLWKKIADAERGGVRKVGRSVKLPVEYAGTQMERVIEHFERRPGGYRPQTGIGAVDAISDLGEAGAAAGGEVNRGAKKLAVEGVAPLESVIGPIVEALNAGLGFGASAMTAPRVQGGTISSAPLTQGIVPDEVARNFITGLATSIAGAPAGAILMLTDPGTVWKQTKKQYADYYGPLLRGDFEQFQKNMAEQPVQVVFDIWAALSLGLGAAARAATLGKTIGATTEQLAGIRRGEAIARSLLFKQQPYDVAGVGPVFGRKPPVRYENFRNAAGETARVQRMVPQSEAGLKVSDILQSARFARTHGKAGRGEKLVREEFEQRGARSRAELATFARKVNDYDTTVLDNAARLLNLRGTGRKGRTAKTIEGNRVEAARALATANDRAGIHGGDLPDVVAKIATEIEQRQNRFIEEGGGGELQARRIADLANARTLLQRYIDEPDSPDARLFLDDLEATRQLANDTERRLVDAGVLNPQTAASMIDRQSRDVERIESVQSPRRAQVEDVLFRLWGDDEPERVATALQLIDAQALSYARRTNGEPGDFYDDLIRRIDTGEIPADALRQAGGDGTLRPDGPVELTDSDPGSSGAGAVPGRGVVRGEPDVLARELRAAVGDNLEGLPGTITVPGLGRLDFGSNKDAQRIASDYMLDAGIAYRPPRTYAIVDPERAARIADEYDRMTHDPSDPDVAAAYDAMIDETLAQYQAIVDAGYEFEFMPEGVDPYGLSPRLAMLDLLENKHLYVFPTDEGFGTLTEISDNPLLGDSGVKWGGRTVTHNDVFRGVHDFFGHFKEGVGFRADGEENAWRSHSAMYTPLARRAMTSETRGQNSWVNYGPHGENNRTARTEQTVFADQKTGVMPQWVIREGAGDGPETPLVDTYVEQWDWPRFYDTEPRPPRGGALVHADGTDIVLGHDADLTTVVHEAAHAFMPEQIGWLAEFDPEWADRVAQRLGIEDGVIDADAQEVYAYSVETWAALGRPTVTQLRDRFDYFRKQSRSIYDGRVKIPEEYRDRVKKALDDPEYTAWIAEMFDPLYGMQAGEGAFFISRRTPLARNPLENLRQKQGIGKSRDRLHARTGVLEEQARDVLGPSNVLVNAERWQRHFEQQAKLDEIRASGHAVPVPVKDGFYDFSNPPKNHTVFNPDGLRGWTRAQNEEMGRSLQAIEASVSLDDADFPQLPIELAERIHTAALDIANAVFLKDGFPAEPQDGRLYYLPNWYKDAFVRDTGGQLINRAVLQNGLQHVATVFKTLNALQRLRMYMALRYVILNVGATGLLNTMHQGLFMPGNLGRAVRMAHAHPDHLGRLEAEVGSGFYEALSAGELQAGAPGVAQLIEKAATAVGHVVSRPEAFLRSTSIIHHLERAGFRTVEQQSNLLDAAKVPGEAREILNQISRWAEEDVVRFRGLPAAERDMLRAIFFVSGWLIAASRFTIRYPANHPFWTTMLAQLGDDGWEEMRRRMAAWTQSTKYSLEVGEGTTKQGVDYSAQTDLGQWLPFGTAADTTSAILSFGSPEAERRVLESLAAGGKFIYALASGEDVYGNPYTMTTALDDFLITGTPLDYIADSFPGQFRAFNHERTPSKQRVDQNMREYALEFVFGRAYPNKYVRDEVEAQWAKASKDTGAVAQRRVRDWAGKAEAYHGSPPDEASVAAKTAMYDWQSQWARKRDDLQGEEALLVGEAKVKAAVMQKYGWIPEGFVYNASSAEELLSLVNDDWEMVAAANEDANAQWGVPQEP
jgi:hypothetical protein